ncbi:unnamed protein product, partial [Linum tenue]
SLFRFWRPVTSATPRSEIFVRPSVFLIAASFLFLHHPLHRRFPSVRPSFSSQLRFSLVFCLSSLDKMTSGSSASSTPPNKKSKAEELTAAMETKKDLTEEIQRLEVLNAKLITDLMVSQESIKIAKAKLENNALIIRELTDGVENVVDKVVNADVVGLDEVNADAVGQGEVMIADVIDEVVHADAVGQGEMIADVLGEGVHVDAVCEVVERHQTREDLKVTMFDLNLKVYSRKRDRG